MEYKSFLQELPDLWHQGEHLTIIAPTGAGKTWLAADILQVRRYVTVLATKENDESYARFRGYQRMQEFNPEYPHERFFLWNKPKVLGDFGKQRLVFYQALQKMYKSGNYTIYSDDLVYLTATLHLEQQYRMLYTIGRSGGLTMVSSLQRPKRIPLEVITQASIIIMLRGYDTQDVIRVGEATGQDRMQISDLNRQLTGRSFIVMQNRAGVPPLLVNRGED